MFLTSRSLNRSRDKDWEANYGDDPQCKNILDSNKISPLILSTVNGVETKDLGFSKLKDEPSLAVHLSLYPMKPLSQSPFFENWMQFTEKGRNIACRDKNLRADFTSERGCDGSTPTYPVRHAPWCGDWNASIIIASIDCGISENGQSSLVTAFSIYSKFGIISAKDNFNYVRKKATGDGYELQLRSKIDPSAEVLFVKEIAVPGYIEYMPAYGHFLNEILGRLLFMDMVLPTSIPMYWPDTPVTNEYFRLLNSSGILSDRKRFVLEMTHGNHRIKPVNLVAKRLYFITTPSAREDGFGDPLCAWVLHRYLHQAIQSLIPKQEKRQSINIRILQREIGGRIIRNIQELIDSLQSAFSTVNVAMIFAKPFQLLENLKSFNEADILIAPHGAGLNNMISMQTKASVVEIGFIDDGFSWPSDYLCLARNLGLRYFSSFALSGNQGSPLDVDVSDVVSIVKTILTT